MKISNLVLIAVASIAFVGTAQAWTQWDVVGIPIIHDGDTVTVNGVKVRLEGIDAPEKDQFCLDSKSQPWACGEAAVAELAKKAGGRLWTCHVSDRSSFDRLLGSCRVDGEDIQRWMVRSGLALSYTRYSHVYDADEKTAREERAGLWSGAFIRPEAWRHRDKATEIVAAVSVPVDAQKILLRPEPPWEDFGQNSGTDPYGNAHAVTGTDSNGTDSAHVGNDKLYPNIKAQRSNHPRPRIHPQGRNHRRSLRQACAVTTLSRKGGRTQQ